MDFTNLKILVVGDICLDIIEEGISTRLSPEAPIPVILNPIQSYALGMAGNVALNLKSLGADVYISTWIKSDEEGRKILSLLDSNGIKYKKQDYYSTNNLTTIVKKRIFANNKQIARIDKEKNINSIDFLNSLEKTFDIYKTNEFDLIIISDYNKGFINRDSWSIMKPILEKYNKGKFYVDTKKLDILNYYEGMYIFPNTAEMNALLEYNNCITRNQLRQEMDLDFIVETASENGAFLYKNDGKIIHAPIFPSNVVDICGAGDTFVTAFALYYTKFQNKIRALEFANYCCSKVIQNQGTTPIHISEVINFDSKSI